MAKKTVSLWVEEEPYEELRKQIQPKSVSREIDEYIKRRLSELQGREYDPLEHVDYESLKRDYRKVVREKAKLITT